MLLVYMSKNWYLTILFTLTENWGIMFNIYITSRGPYYLCIQMIYYWFSMTCMYDNIKVDKCTPMIFIFYHFRIIGIFIIIYLKHNPKAHFFYRWP